MPMGWRMKGEYGEDRRFLFQLFVWGGAEKWET
jgi:hypothetical protein